MDCEGQAVSIPCSWASCCLVSPQHSVSDVELLLCRHRDLEKLLAAQEEKFVQLQWKEAVSKGGEGTPGDGAPVLVVGAGPASARESESPQGTFPLGKPLLSLCQL